MSLRNVIEAINKNKHFLITSHINLEGDALGSQLALARLLEYLGKQAVVVNEDEAPPEYRFLPQIEKIKKPKEKFNFDVAIVVDCSDLKRIGAVSKIIGKDKFTINIDHHISNLRFAKINWVDKRSSSCVEMIYRLYKKLNVPIKKDVALLLYVGLVTDTGSFRYPNTTSYTHKVASELLHYRLPITEIYRKIYESASFSDMMLLIEILKTLKKDKTGKIAWLVWKIALNSKKTSFDLTDILLNFVRSIKNIEVAILFKELEDKVRVNFRSQGRFDVNRLARFFDGGGHKTASGCTVKADLEEAQAMVIKKAQRLIRKKIVK